MSTSGSFTPPGTPPCPTNVFTRAALLALRTAGTLRTECHYLVTGPVIGTAGNTSPTTIELHAVSATELALEAKVHTTFQASAFEGLFDIDKGTAGSIIRLVGTWNNVGIDADVDSPTIHTQIPWHLGGNNFRDNVFNDAVLPGWAGMIPGSAVTDNSITGSTVDLTGVTIAHFFNNQIQNSTVESHTTISNFELNILNAASMINLGSGTFAATQNTMLGGSISVDATSTAQTTVSDNIIGGMNNGYRIVAQGKTGGNLAIQGNRLFGRGAGAQELRVAGPAAITVNQNEITGGSINADGTGFTLIEGNTLGGSVLDQVAASAGDFTVTRSQVTNTAVTIGAANVGVTFIDQCTLRGGILDLRGPVAGGGRNDFIHATILDVVATVAATATAGLKLEGGLYDKGIINQNRTAGTLSTTLNECTTLGIACVITDNGTVNPGQAVNLNRLELTDSTVTIGNLTAARTIPDVVSQVEMNASLLFVSGLGTGGEIKRGRMLNGNITNAGFTLDSFTLDGMVKTLGANQANRAGSVAFDNYL